VAPVILVSLVASSPAAVTVSASASPTQGLPGYNTWLVRAHSDAPMQGFDFAGDGSNDPATGRGFFGPMNQRNPFGMPTVFEPECIIECRFDVPRLIREDSHFPFRTVNLVIPSGKAEEGPNLLQGIWAHSSPVGMDFALAQIVVPNGGAFSYRGLISVLENGSIVEVPIEGRFPIPEPASAVLAGFMAMSWLLVRRASFRFQ
jgi:hypothetical protein